MCFAVPAWEEFYGKPCEPRQETRAQFLPSEIQWSRVQFLPSKTQCRSKRLWIGKRSLVSCSEIAHPAPLAGTSAVNGTLSDPLLDRLPGVVAGAFMRRRLEAHFQKVLMGDVLTYAEEQDLHVHLLRPPASSSTSWNACKQREGGAPDVGQRKQACIVFLHGGGFLGGAPSQFYSYAHTTVKEFGVAAACCEFRSFLRHPRSRIPFDAITDVTRCIKFLQSNAEELGLDEQKIVLVGASSGGHLAAMAALNAEAEANTQNQKGLGLAGLVLFNPVLDLCFADEFFHRRVSVWLGAWLLRLRYGQLALESASPIMQVQRLPYPTLILHGTDDKLVPISEVEAFSKELQSMGSSCDLVKFDREGHFFFNWRVSPRNYVRCVELLAEFLTSTGVTDENPFSQAVNTE